MCDRAAYPTRHRAGDVPALRRLAVLLAAALSTAATVANTPASSAAATAAIAESTSAILQGDSARAARDRPRTEAAPAPGPADAQDMDVIETSLKAELLDRGYHALLGQTMPLRELMLWRRQSTGHYDVQLPDGPYRVPVPDASVT